MFIIGQKGLKVMDKVWNVLKSEQQINIEMCSDAFHARGGDDLFHLITSKSSENSGCTLNHMLWALFSWFSLLSPFLHNMQPTLILPFPFPFWFAMFS